MSMEKCQNGAFSMPQCSLMSMGTPPPLFFISKLKFSYDKYPVGKVWTKICCHFYFRGNTLSDQQAQLIRNIECLSMALYEHYWLCTGTILLDKEIVKVISDCLGISQLKPFCDKAGLKEGHRVHSVTDKLKETWERMASKSDTSDIVSAVIHSSQVNSGKNASDLGFTVDRCCDNDVIMETVDRSRTVAMRTVDRSVVTQNLEKDAVHLPCVGFQELNQGHSDSGLHGNELTVQK